MTRSFAAACVLFAVAAAGCRPAPEPVHDRFPALGTLIDVTLYADDPEHGAHALRELRALFAEAGHDWAAWGDGALARYNDGAAAADAGLQALLDEAAALERASGGLFNPAIGALTELWGFHRQEREAGPPPDDDAIRLWLNGEVPPRVDLGAFAKGVALRHAVSRLEGMGVRHALINAGGDIAVLGDANGRPWRIGLRDPRGPGVFAGVELSGREAIVTSGDYERAFEWEGVRYHHILDPRTGAPARGTVAFTVIHHDPALADAAATALFVAGDDWPPLAQRLGVDDAMRVTADGHVELTATMDARLRFELLPRDKVIVDAIPASR